VQKENYVTTCQDLSEKPERDPEVLSKRHTSGET
jgi:hypothetical protein